jgi:hypothetical protein
MAGTDAETRAQVERILQSEALSSSKVLRDLFSFLAEKSLSGQAHELKEYSVAIDALGKPPTYDPRHDSTVRIQVGRLRQKLAEYYRSEGKDDSIVIELPKRKFVLSWHAHIGTRASDLAQVGEAANWPRAFTVVVAVLIAVSAWACYSTLLLWHDRKTSSLFMAAWSPELQTLWDRSDTKPSVTLGNKHAPFRPCARFGIFSGFLAKPRGGDFGVSADRGRAKSASSSGPSADVQLCFRGRSD